MILCLPIPDAEDDWGEAESAGPATEESIYDTEGQALSPYFTMAKKHGEKLAEIPIQRRDPPTFPSRAHLGRIT